jgi:hypothetical protein
VTAETLRERPSLGRLAGPWPDCYGAVSRREEGKGMDDRAFASTTALSEQIHDRRIGCVELLDF